MKVLLFHRESYDLDYLKSLDNYDLYTLAVLGGMLDENAIICSPAKFKKLEKDIILNSYVFVSK